MRLFKTVFTLAVVCFLVACGGGEAEIDQAPAPLSSAKPVAVADALCTSGGPEYLLVNGQCQKSFLGISAPPKSSALAAPKDAQAQASPSVSAFFDWAGPAFPLFFGYSYSQGDIYVGGYGTFTYRYYYGTGNYLGVLNGYVYVYGPVTYYQMLTVGPLSDYYCSVYNCYARTFISWAGSVNGVFVKDSGNEDFSFYSDTRCLYSYARDQETTNFCLNSGSSGSFAGQPVIVMSAMNVLGTGCLAVLADPYGRQIDIYTDVFGTQTVRVLSTYWNAGGC